MAGDHPADPALVELVVAALPVDPDDGTMVVGYDEGAPRSGIPQWGPPEPVARAVLSALATEGRLLPPDAETRWGWLSVDGTTVYTSPSEQAARLAASRSGARRLMRRWVCPWQPAPTDTEGTNA